MGLTFEDTPTANDSMEPLSLFDFDAFLKDIEEEANFDWLCPPEMANATVAVQPFTPMHSANCFPVGEGFERPSSPVPDARLEALMELANATAKSNIRAIIDVHRASKGVAEAPYPEDLQNLLLTTSRTIGAIATHLEDVAKKSARNATPEPLDTLELDLMNCDMICQQVREGCPQREGTSSIVVQSHQTELWREFRHTYEMKICKFLQPLLVYYKHMKW
jgi:hypothetical protein